MTTRDKSSSSSSESGSALGATPAVPKLEKLDQILAVVKSIWSLDAQLKPQPFVDALIEIRRICESRSPDGDGPSSSKEAETPSAETNGEPQGSTLRTPLGAGSEPADSLPSQGAADALPPPVPQPEPIDLNTGKLDINTGIQ